MNLKGSKFKFRLIHYSQKQDKILCTNRILNPSIQPVSNNIIIKLWTLELSPQKIQDFEHMSNWIWTNTTFISWIWMTCYDSSLSDQDDPRSSEFFCLISATSIVTEEFFRQSQIFTLLNSLLWDGKIPWVPDFPRANKRYNKRQHALILFKSVNNDFFSISWGDFFL